MVPSHFPRRCYQAAAGSNEKWGGNRTRQWSEGNAQRGYDGRPCETFVESALFPVGTGKGNDSFSLTDITFVFCSFRGASCFLPFGKVSAGLRSILEPDVLVDTRRDGLVQKN